MRRWIKIWTQESLTGTLRFDFTPEQRGVWYDLLVLAGSCRLEGVIAAGPGSPYPHEWIAGMLNITLGLLEDTLKICEKSERITENGQGILIINWNKYQSEYERQKPYREAKKFDKSDPDRFKEGDYSSMVKTKKRHDTPRIPE